MKLTKAQRHKYYKEALKQLSPDEGICCILSYVVLGCSNHITIVKYFPELIKFKPPNTMNYVYWFGWPDMDTYEERKKVLRQCIRETSPKKRLNRKPK